MQFPARNVDVYMVDMERIEVLEGPQGTLFGGGAEAGAIRYITNKPKLDVTEGNVEAGYGITAHGDPNTSVNAMINLPLIHGHTRRSRGDLRRSARRLHQQRAEHFTRLPTDLGLATYRPRCIRRTRPAANNYNLAGQRARIRSPTPASALLALWQINDDWNVLVQQSYQNMEADGVFYAVPDRLGRVSSSARGGDVVHSGLRQGQVREHGLDGQRPGRRL